MVTHDGTNAGSGSLEQGWHTVDVDGISVAYEVRGSGPVVLAHAGGPGLGAGYLRMPLVEEFATVVYLDPVGTGRSDRIPDGDYSMAAYARIAAAVIAALPGGRAVFLGHSHGAMVALQLALDHPEVLDGAIVYEGRSTFEDHGAEATERVEAFRRRFADDPVAADVLAAWYEPTPEHADDGARDVRRTRLLPVYLRDFRARADLLQLMVQTLESFTDPNRQDFNDWDVRPRLPEVRVPVSVFVGKYDFICTPAAAAVMWQDIPAAELVTFDDSGHVAHVEEPEAFAAAVHHFVTERAAAPSHESPVTAAAGQA